jgi:3-carboxy-cis,cis-muconate cycloisomerase
MVQEHERGVGGWQAEWPIVASIIQALGLAVVSMAETAEGLTVDAERMRANIQATRGNIFAERVVMLLGAELGRDVARKLIEESTRKSTAERRPLMDVLAEVPEVTRIIHRATLSQLDSPEDYLGMAAAFQKRLVVPPKR